MTALRLSSASFNLTDRPYPRDACGACASLSPILFFCTHVQECFSTAKTTRNTRKLFALEITENLWTKCIGGFGFIWKRTQNRQSFESLRASQDLLMARAYSRPTQTLPSVAATSRSRLTASCAHTPCGRVIASSLRLSHAAAALWSLKFDSTL